jgi:hypothetical protein|tara:strand:- start:255 stop:455 length:201 start_codon:yes stop_codon:yes gene_type:complete
MAKIELNITADTLKRIAGSFECEEAEVKQCIIDFLMHRVANFESQQEAEVVKIATREKVKQEIKID